MIEITTCILLLLGAAFMLLAAVGVLRLPDVYLRLQATTKAITLGIGSMMAAVAIFFHDSGGLLRAGSVVLFFFLTAPVAGHIIARAAYFVGVQIWEGTVIDELRGRYDERTHQLRVPEGWEDEHNGPA